MMNRLRGRRRLTGKELYELMMRYADDRENDWMAALMGHDLQGAAGYMHGEEMI